MYTHYWVASKLVNTGLWLCIVIPILYVLKRLLLIEVPEGYRVIVTRFGKARRCCEAGWNFLIPLIEQVVSVNWEAPMDEVEGEPEKPKVFKACVIGNMIPINELHLGNFLLEAENTQIQTIVSVRLLVEKPLSVYSKMVNPLAHVITLMKEQRKDNEDIVRLEDRMNNIFRIQSQGLFVKLRIIRHLIPDEIKAQMLKQHAAEIEVATKKLLVQSSVEQIKAMDDLAYQNIEKLKKQYSNNQKEIEWWLQNRQSYLVMMRP